MSLLPQEKYKDEHLAGCWEHRQSPEQPGGPGAGNPIVNEEHHELCKPAKDGQFSETWTPCHLHSWDTGHREQAKQCDWVSDATVQAPQSQGSRPGTANINADTHMVWFSRKLPAGDAELNNTAVMAGQGIQKQRQGTEELLVKMLNDPVN